MPRYRGDDFDPQAWRDRQQPEPYNNPDTGGQGGGRMRYPEQGPPPTVDPSGAGPPGPTVTGSVPQGGGPGGGYPFGNVGPASNAYGQIYNNLPNPSGQTQIDVSQFSQPSPYEQSLRSAIMNAIAEGQRPVNESDPLIAPMVSSMRGQAQRAMEQNQQIQGERLFAQGIPTSSGAWDTRVGGFNQLTNEGTSGQIANLMVNQLTDRKNRLMTALNIGTNYLNAEQSRILQAELANVNSALTQYGLKSNVSLGLLSALLGNAHFYDQLGTNANMFAANQNNNFLRGIGL